MSVRAFAVAGILLLAISSYLSGNPIVVYMINEYQTAPDSSERIEFHQIPYVADMDLCGWKVTSKAGTSWISESVVLGEDDYVVIDSTNTFGIFDLGDEEDSIAIIDHRYPEYPYWLIYPSIVPAPPEGASMCLFTKVIGWLDSEVTMLDYYVDNSPTFGDPNDDYHGCCVYGGVYSAVDSTPIDEASLYFQFCESDYHYCPGVLRCETMVHIDSLGAYQVDSLYPCRYEVSVEAEGWIIKTRTVRTEGALHPTEANFYLVKTGTESEQSRVALDDAVKVWPNPFVQEVRIQPPVGTEWLQIFDGSGRLLSELPVQGLAKWNGRDSLGRNLPPGAYFIKFTHRAGSHVKKLIKLK